MSDSGSGFPPAGRSTGGRVLGFVRGALGSAILIIALVSAMWLIEFIDYFGGMGLDSYGIVSHSVGGLPGILLAPFLHAGFDHLMANTLPLLILGFLAAIRGIGKFFAASLIIVGVSGVGVWFINMPNTLTVGASGLVFGYFGYVVARGFFDRRILDIVLGVLVAVLYYSILWGVLPTQPGVSWQGHLFGLVGGVLAAWLLRRRPAAL